MKIKGLFENARYDLPASIVVFFVAMPLCLGIALASGAPLFSGIIAGIVGGIIVGMASGSPLGVSGPAAGLAVIVLSAIATLGSWQAFLVSVVIAGILQIVMGYLRLGIIAYYFPTSVIKGMLTGIGLIIILKQIPHALGYDADYEGDLSFQTAVGNTFSDLSTAFEVLTPGALIISAVSLTILILWEAVLTKTHRIFQLIQGPVVVVVAGIILNQMFQAGILPFSLTKDQLVNIPVASDLGEFFGQFSLPDFSHLTNPQVYFTAMVVALIASIETLLCVEATDKLDPYKRVTPTNRELKAQGLGNVISGLIGGLPITQVIVRSSTNITFGGKTKLSAITHGFFLLISAIAIPNILNMIPLATLACILFVVGYKLAKPTLFKSMYQLGLSQFIPFVATVVGIVFTDLLTGIGIGMAFAIFYILRGHYQNPYVFHASNTNGREMRTIALAEEVSFLNKGSLLQTLNHLPGGADVVIDAKRTKIIDHDVIEVIRDFIVNAKNKDIRVRIEGIPVLEKVSRENDYQRITEKEITHSEA
ncbi:Sulfate transporter [Fulvivirga imtechensis AK7]|uniref:Sulfate transporter n=1 Tax=Fulvivirga imtechensis AK7 TaxID=1237149 RepID=L8JPB7_9BACT|nr:SulP family inorganic anion transporter [Fulvivirga imtechensis]ELR70053.1 Sulfate transporter [Fulvivirga imtechensis AK7]